MKKYQCPIYYKDIQTIYKRHTYNIHTTYKGYTKWQQMKTNY